jgi:hypothetical protein
LFFLKTLKGRQLQLLNFLLVVRGGSSKTDQVRDQETTSAEEWMEQNLQVKEVPMFMFVASSELATWRTLSLLSARGKEIDHRFKDLIKKGPKKTEPPFLFVV